MTFPNPSALGQEWATLQNNHEQYERTSLLVKLSAIAIFVACIALFMPIAVTLLLMLLMWLQEAILRTSQSRLGERLLRIEQCVAEGDVAPGYQLHSEWQASRPGFAGLLVEYARNMLRPTVAVPYAALMAMTAVLFVLG